MSKTLVAACVAFALLLPGCGTVKGDMETMCNLRTVCPPLENEPASVRAMKQAECLEGKIKTSEGKKVIAALSGVSPSDRPRLMRNAAKEAGVMSCPEADAIEKELTPK